ncbi:uncharacterized protein VTP21DRAFT_5180 [Calcarisporiella thermophila]|uniref:uncharacterized protein n=1 Tax=Calcarisporiella thermophila TaxID=911321 RepID=UPI003743505F
MENIQTIFIRETESRPDPKPHTVYRIEVHAPVRTWSVWRRYSEFDALHNKLLRIAPSPTVPLPAKTLWSPFQNQASLVEDRRRGLEEYLRGILASRDDRWRKSEEWKEFLAIPTGRSLDPAQQYTLQSWLDEYGEMQNTVREIRNLINRRETHMARNEISAGHNCTLQAKRLLTTLGNRIGSLDAGLVALANGGGDKTGTMLSEGELRRRQDKMNELRDERETLTKLVIAGRQENGTFLQTSSSMPNTGERNALLYNHQHSTPLTKPPSKPVSRRVFGNAAISTEAPKETEETRGLDNEGLVRLQQEMMLDQDKQMEQFSAILQRQRHLGLAIGNELDTHNRLLDELDSSVERTDAKLKLSRKTLNKIK